MVDTCYFCKNPLGHTYTQHWGNRCHLECVPMDWKDRRIAALEAQLAEAKQALEIVLTGLEAGCNQYANRTFAGAEVPGDEQLPWVRLMQIGRDAARRALEATPPAPKVTDEMVEAASREYMRIFGKHLLSDHARLILTAAREAGKP